MAVIKAADIVDFVIKAKNAGWGCVAPGRFIHVSWRNGRLREIWQGLRLLHREVPSGWQDRGGLLRPVDRAGSKIPGYATRRRTRFTTNRCRRQDLHYSRNTRAVRMAQRAYRHLYRQRQVIESGASVGVVLSSSPRRPPEEVTNWGGWRTWTIPIRQSKQPILRRAVGRYLKIKAPYMRGEMWNRSAFAEKQRV